MTRPRLAAEWVSTNIRLDRAVHTALKNAARERDVSVNYLVGRAVAAYLPRLVNPDDFLIELPLETPPADTP